MKRAFFPYIKEKIIPVPDGVTSGFFPPDGAVESCHQVLLIWIKIPVFPTCFVTPLSPQGWLASREAAK
jgi:hypothetical protein